VNYYYLFFWLFTVFSGLRGDKKRRKKHLRLIGKKKKRDFYSVERLQISEYLLRNLVVYNLFCNS